MKTILIIYSHWPPSNLAGVHRARLISNFLYELGWQPVILTVSSEFYEEKPDNNLSKTVSPQTEVEFVDAKPVGRIRFFGDITLRAFGNLKKRAIEIINSRKIDFLWIPIPSYYTAILGRKIYKKTKIPYGIDYIDPWVDGFPGQEKFMSRAWISNQIAKFMEPYSVKKASLISGVSTPYYQAVLDRNFKNQPIAHVGMPYGFDPNDHKIRLENVDLPWDKIPNCKPLIYAGAILPKSHLFLNELFRTIAKLKKENILDPNVHLFFIGTGSYKEKTIENYAAENGISEIVHEDKNRFPFLHILNYLSQAYGVMIIGSTESHYTASKTFQALLSERPVFAVFHAASSAVGVMQAANAANYLVCWDEETSATEFSQALGNKFKNFAGTKSAWKPNLKSLEKYSAKESAKKLVEKLNQITP